MVEGPTWAQWEEVKEMKLSISDNLSPIGIDVLIKAGLDVNVNTGLAPKE